MMSFPNVVLCKFTERQFPMALHSYGYVACKYM